MPEGSLSSLAGLIDAGLNPAESKTIGFALVVFDFDEPAPGRIHYISNGQDACINVALRQIVGQLNGEAHPEGDG